MPGAVIAPDAPHRPLALVVDDEVVNRTTLAKVLRKEGYDVVEGADGEEAVRLARERRPSLILLDIDMPRKSGLEALEEIREADPDVPVVIVTASDEPGHGREALELGAVNFLRKPYDVQEVRFVAERILAALREEADIRPALRMLRERRTALEIGNDLALLSKVVAFLGHELKLHYPGYDVPATDVKLALYEALANAVEHGNLEISYDEKTKALESEGGITRLIGERASAQPYKDRTVLLDASYEVGRVVYRIRDAGRGFRHEAIAQEKSLGDTSALHGRGILLIKHYMDEVRWNREGNEVVMTLGVAPRAPKGT